ncbi:hypothetical protein NDU88_006062 [Pleurodeles waltl]|uniref:Uncharacterized protein n=1 Tax=Pleurodeles waltl TaxID=8319 RepID=A0AAV7WCV3_PLEWA|nr:hypothetical protein NDU88_006062 [Pleurodeles waltl]
MSNTLVLDVCISERDRAGRQLVQLIQSESRMNPFLMLPDELGQTVTSQKAINEIFIAHIRRIYESPHTTVFPALSGYLAELRLPLLEPEERRTLGAQLTKQELMSAINALKSSKSPGGWDTGRII